MKKIRAVVNGRRNIRVKVEGETKERNEKRKEGNVGREVWMRFP